MRKKFIRSVIAAIMLVAFAQHSDAQIGLAREYVEPPGWSLGTTVGMSDLWADVGTKSLLDHYSNSEYFKKPCFMGGLFGRYSFHPSFALRFGVNYGTLYANDIWNKGKAFEAESIEDDAYQRYIRNQSVRTNIWEGSLLFEIAPLRFNPTRRGAMRRFQPLILLGVGYMHFNAQAELIDENKVNRGYVDLYELNIEGNGVNKEIYPEAPEEYKQWQLVIPAGLGVRWDIGRRLSLGVEWLYRYTFTDYLDGVSGRYVSSQRHAAYLTPEQAYQADMIQNKTWLINHNLPPNGENEYRGNPENDDSYSTFGLTFIFKVPSKKEPWW